MAIQDKSTLKTYFKTGKKPTQAQFENLIDSFAALNVDGSLNLSDAIMTSDPGNPSASKLKFYVLGDARVDGKTHTDDLYVEGGGVFFKTKKENKGSQFVIRSSQGLPGNDFVIYSIKENIDNPEGNPIYTNCIRVTDSGKVAFGMPYPETTVDAAEDIRSKNLFVHERLFIGANYRKAGEKNIWGTGSSVGSSDKVYYEDNTVGLVTMKPTVGFSQYENIENQPSLGLVLHNEVATNTQRNITLGFSHKAGYVGNAKRLGAAIMGSFPGSWKSELAFFTTTQLNVFAERMRIDSEGNVGIGTPTPDKKLHVQGDLKVTGQILDNEGNPYALEKDEVKNELTLGDPTNPNGKLIVNGKVGIGKNNPSIKLDIGSQRYGSVGLDLKSTSELAIFAGGSEAIRVDYNGNVGIGVTDFKSRLHIKDETNSGHFIGGVEVKSKNVFVVERAAKQDLGPILLISNPQEYRQNFLGEFEGGGGAIDFSISSPGSYHSKCPSFRIQSSADAEGYGASDLIFLGGSEYHQYGKLYEKMRIASNGNVGIGISKPNSQLHVKNDITVEYLIDDRGGVPGTSTSTVGSFLLLKGRDEENDVKIINKLKPKYQYGYDIDRFAINIGGKDVISINNSNRKVGIGVSKPEVHLDIYSDSTTEETLVQLGKSAPEKLGPILLLKNSGDEEKVNKKGTGCAIDFNVFGDRKNDYLEKYVSFQILNINEGEDRHSLTFSSLLKGRIDDKLKERMRITDFGFVGIGTNAPKARLHLIGNETIGYSENTVIISKKLSKKVGPVLLLENTAGDEGAGCAIDFKGNSNSYNYNGLSDGSFRIQSINIDNSSSHLAFLSRKKGHVNSLEERMRITAEGNVGIGTSSPTKAKLEVIGGVAPSDNIAHAYFAKLAADPLPADGVDKVLVGFHTDRAGQYSIYADQRIAGSEFNAHSDLRIKTPISPSNNQIDLSTLLNIKVTDYTHKDIVQHGTKQHKKVIGQQVKEVFPQAVSFVKEVVPDIYQPAKVKGGRIQLATDLKVGEKVRIITKEKTELYEVTKVSGKSFKVSGELPEGGVFVYGREVDDFHLVDYEAIAMLNVSATQEIYRQLEAEKQKVKALEEGQRKLWAIIGKERVVN